MKTLQGDCREKLRELEENSIDAIVTDPPYGLEFMGKDWDAPWKTDRRQNFDGTLKDQRENPYGRSKVRNGGGASYGADARVMQALQEWYYSWAVECLRVLKPGGHLLSFGGSRTYHRMACAIEDAGFEIRDQIMWLYGCLDEHTELVSESGVKPHHKAKIGERVLCYNLESGEYSYQPILEIVEYNYSDTAYRLIGDFGEQVISRNHRCIVERNGGEVFQFAEETAWQCETRVPVLESLPELQQALFDLQSNSSGTEQIVQYEVLQCADRGGEQCADSAGEAEREDDFLRGLRNEEMGASSMAEEGEDSSVQPQVQWRSPRRGVEATRTQGAEALETGVGVCVEDSDDWPNQSSVEGRIDLPEAQRGVCRPVDQVRPLSASIFVHGAEGWLCDGAPSTGRSSYGQATPESGSGASQEPQGYGKPTDKPDAICDERGTQGIRAWRGHKTAVVRVVPFQYTGKMWCLRVPTGAFVAFRGGVAFPTGNSGFPKSLDVSKAIDKAGGRAENWFGPWLRDERERIGLSATRLAELGNFYKNVNHGGLVVNWELGYGLPSVKEFNKVCEILSLPFERLEEVERQVIGQRKVHKGVAFTSDGKEYLDVTLPATDAAKQWTGWGTALKPAHEPICVARKPIEGTVAANVLKWGTGALNIDGCRVEYLSEADKASATPQGECTAKVGALAGGTQNETERSAFERPEQKGRWPANVIHDGSEEVLAAFPNAPVQCADVKYDAEERKTQNIYGAMKRGHEPSAEQTYEEEGSTNFAMKPGARRLDSGSAARFFYCAKTSKSERGEGNSHPTVKPIALMRYLCKLVTPPGGVILDPFMGSGSTGLAAIREGFEFIGIELNPDYIKMANSRLLAEILK